MTGRYSTLPPIVKAITVRQPFASAIVAGVKTVENRTWRTSHRGPLLVHAAAGSELPTVAPNVVAALERHARAIGDRPRGVIIGIVTLVDVVRVSGGEVEDDEWAVGPWCWVLRDAIRFADPVPYRGALSLFGVGREVFGSTLNQSTYPWRAIPSNGFDIAEQV